MLSRCDVRTLFVVPCLCTECVGEIRCGSHALVSACHASRAGTGGRGLRGATLARRAVSHLSRTATHLSSRDGARAGRVRVLSRCVSLVFTAKNRGDLRSNIPSVQAAKAAESLRSCKVAVAALAAPAAPPPRPFRLPRPSSCHGRHFSLGGATRARRGSSCRPDGKGRVDGVGKAGHDNMAQRIASSGDAD